MFYALFVCGHYFFSTGLSKSAFSTYYFGELVYFLSFIFYVFFVISFEFDVIFTELQHIIIVFISAMWPCVILLSLDQNILFVKVI